MAKDFILDKTVYVIIGSDDGWGEELDIDIDCRFDPCDECKHFETRNGTPSKFRWACRFRDFGGAGRCHNPAIRTEVIAKVINTLKEELNKQAEKNNDGNNGGERQKTNGDADSGANHQRHEEDDEANGGQPR